MADDPLVIEAGVHKPDACVIWLHGLGAKDSKNRFAGNPLWGEGWGWALFKPQDSSKNVASNFQTDCLGCHVPAKDRDWVYTEAYPTLTAD